LRCKHCYSNSGGKGKNIDEKFLLDILKKIQPLRLVISGGDPLVDFGRLYRFLVDFYAIHEGNCQIVIATNGTLIDQDRLDKLAPYVDRYQISLDTLSKEKYRDIRGVDLLEKSLEGIKLVAGQGLDMQIAFALFDENIKEIPDVVDFCVKNKVKKINVLRRRPTGRSDEPLAPKKIKEAYLMFKGLCTKNDIKLIIHDPIANAIGIPSICYAGIKTLAIDAEGNYKPCPLFERSEKGNFDEIWEGEFFNDVRKVAPECKGCEIKRCLGGCKACHYNMFGKKGKDPSCLLHI
jgi:MoaA/NifB/PqqE/SkfB family radical SAM enzyme